MYIILFLVVSTISFIYFLVSNRINGGWKKILFFVNGSIFTLIAIIIPFIYIHEQKIRSFVNIGEIDQVKVAKATSHLEDIMFTNIIPGELVDKKQKNENESDSIKKSMQLQVPLIEQLPELPRGCEVTSLSMLLQHNDIEIDKMSLANKVHQDSSKYRVVDGKIHFGNPYYGFVGDMYSFDTPGLGVYHGPIADLAKEYVGERVYDFTGEGFSAIITELNEGRPVWVIINATYKELPEDSFITWHTKHGPIEITMRQHSVLITGYDEKYIYFNDPLNKENKALIKDFEAAWIQMGKQAMTIH